MSYLNSNLQQYLEQLWESDSVETLSMALFWVEYANVMLMIKTEIQQLFQTLQMYAHREISKAMASSCMSVYVMCVMQNILFLLNKYLTNDTYLVFI